MAPLKILLAVVGLAFLCGCGESSTSASFNGYVEAELIYVSALESGWIVSNMVNEGDRVDRGQLLFELDNDRQRFDLNEALARFSQAEAQVNDLSIGARPDEISRLNAQLKEAAAARALAEVELRRISALRAKGLVSQSNVDQVKAEFNVAAARVDSIEAQIRLANLAARENTLLAAKAALNTTQVSLERAKWRLEQRVLRAPRSGRIEQVYFREGEQLGARSPALALLPDDGLKARFFVPQHKLSSVPVGTEVSVKQDGVVDDIIASVSFVSREPEYTPPVIYSVKLRQKMVFLVEAKLPAGSGLHPGQPVDIDLLDASQ